MNEYKAILVKEGNKWIETSRQTDKTEVYKSLMQDLLNKKIHKCSYITGIKDYCNYDGTRTITVYFDNNCKAIYKVEA